MLISKTIVANDIQELDRLKQEVLQNSGATAVNGSVAVNGLHQYVWSGELLIPDSQPNDPVPGGIQKKIHRR